jgi:hypothetical protein
VARTIFKAKDHSEHTTEAEADKRDRLVNASAALEEAGKKVAKCLAEKALTADGLHFEWRWRDYWVVRGGIWDMPRPVVVNCYPHSCSVDVERERILIRFYEHDRKEYVSFDINELYSTEKAA